MVEDRKTGSPREWEACFRRHSSSNDRTDRVEKDIKLEHQTS